MAFVSSDTALRTDRSDRGGPAQRTSSQDGHLADIAMRKVRHMSPRLIGEALRPRHRNHVPDSTDDVIKAAHSTLVMNQLKNGTCGLER
jgi:hypothetical protein